MKETISGITNINCLSPLIILTSNNDQLCNYHLYIDHLVTDLVVDYLQILFPFQDLT
jgi:hypothetical protein